MQSAKYSDARYLDGNMAMLNFIPPTSNQKGFKIDMIYVPTIFNSNVRDTSFLQTASFLVNSVNHSSSKLSEFIKIILDNGLVYFHGKDDT